MTFFFFHEMFDEIGVFNGSNILSTSQMSRVGWNVGSVKVGLYGLNKIDTIL